MGHLFTAEVYNADANGFPNTLLDSTTTFVNNYGWVEVSGLNAVVSSGDFFIVMVQKNAAPDCPYLGVDETLPMAYKSYSRDVVNGGQWAVSPYQDFMIRAIVSGAITSDDKMTESKEVIPQPMDGMISTKASQTVPGYDGMKAFVITPEGGDNPLVVLKFGLDRIYIGAANPVPPENGAYTIISNLISNTTYVDGGTTWNGLAQGWYAYGIRAVYPGTNQISEFIFTNPVPHKLYANLVVNAKLQCGMLPAEGAIFKLTGLYYPYDVYVDTIPASGTFDLIRIIKGEYSFQINYPGYTTYSNKLNLIQNDTLDIILNQVHFAPKNLKVDNTTLIATWDQPLETLLSEHFESGIFPPSGWQATSQNAQGWYATNNGSSAVLPVPSHGMYAISNDNQGGASNNGCCDYLITPSLDLSNGEGYKLHFQSYFNGYYGEIATIEMSTDNGASWNVLANCPPSSLWQEVNIDLSGISGSGGLSSVKLAFHASDAAHIATGWAIDDVEVSTSNIAVSSYKVYLNGSEAGETAAWSFTFDPGVITYGQVYQASVAAVYCTGKSDTVARSFSSHYLFPPVNLTADTSITSHSGAAILKWQPPLQNLANLTGYHLYRDADTVFNLASTDTTFTNGNLLPGSYCYRVSAVYNLTQYGLPGQTGESIKEGPACVSISYGLGMPLYEDFSSGVFDTTMWHAGQNWLIDDQSDNPVPAAKFKWNPLMKNYSSALESTIINAKTVNNNLPHVIWFDFDVKLEDQSASATERLTVEVWDEWNWHTAKQYINTGNMDWKHEHLDITSLVPNDAFKVRFKASGDSSAQIHYWAVDNIDIKTGYELSMPTNLVVNSEGSPANNNHLTWTAPVGSIAGSVNNYTLDDSSYENAWAIEQGYEGWLGNEFVVSDSGNLQSVDLYWIANPLVGTSPVSIDIFDVNRELVGSSPAFVPADNAWQSVALPDIPFNGTFYAMVHFPNQSAATNWIASDENGPHAASDYGWSYDVNGGWQHLSAFGWNHNVFLLRAKALIGGDQMVGSFGPVSDNSQTTATAFAKHIIKSNSITGSVHVGRMALKQVTAISNLVGYNIYRRAYSAFPAGQNTTAGSWEKINASVVAPTEYVDANLSNLITNCYEYQVTAVFELAESSPSNVGWDCIFVGVNPNDETNISIFPNPANTMVSIDLSHAGHVNTIMVYNSMGSVVEKRTVNGETLVSLNISDFATGVYDLKFTTLMGGTCNKKLIVTK